MEWETYRREVGRLLAEGHEGQFVLIKGNDILGFFDTDDAAWTDGIKRFGRQGFMVHQIQTYEPILRFHCRCPCHS